MSPGDGLTHLAVLDVDGASVLSACGVLIPRAEVGRYRRDDLVDSGPPCADLVVCELCSQWLRVQCEAGIPPASLGE